MSESITSFLQLFISKGLPFVLCRLPAEQELIFVAQKTRNPEEIKLSRMDNLRGFLVAGFTQAKAGFSYFIRPDIVLSKGVISRRLLNEVEALPNVSETPPQTEPVQSKRSYLKSAREIIGKLTSGELQKVVLSRVIQTETGMIDKGILFTKLEQKYPDAFVYLTHLPRMGTWAGATPETLFKVKEGFAETVALAGTAPIEKIHWTDKEKEEQEMVATYIVNALREEGIHVFEKSAPETIRAGKLAHLKTTFKIPVEQLKGKTGSFIGRLHPTPAVCGLPKDKAFDLIRQVENHDRGFYTGFLGPWNLNGKSHLFVNLRCARLKDSSTRLFVGGGITAKSNAEAEWEETVNKSETLLSVLKKL